MFRGLEYLGDGELTDIRTGETTPTSWNRQSLSEAIEALTPTLEKTQPERAFVGVHPDLTGYVDALDIVVFTKGINTERDRQIYLAAGDWNSEAEERHQLVELSCYEMRELPYLGRPKNWDLALGIVRDITLDHRRRYEQIWPPQPPRL